MIKHSLAMTKRVYRNLCEKNKGKKPDANFRGQQWVFGWPMYLAACQDVTTLKSDENKKTYERIKRGSDWKKLRVPKKELPLICHDCAAKDGEYHAIGCDCEQCPRCEKQLICCGCFDLD